MGSQIAIQLVSRVVTVGGSRQRTPLKVKLSPTILVRRLNYGLDACTRRAGLCTQQRALSVFTSLREGQDIRFVANLSVVDLWISVGREGRLRT